MQIANLITFNVNKTLHHDILSSFYEVLSHRESLRLLDLPAAVSVDLGVEDPEVGLAQHAHGAVRATTQGHSARTHQLERGK